MKITNALSVLVLVAASCYAQAPTIIQPSDPVSESRDVINHNFLNLYNQVTTGIVSSPNQIIFNNSGAPGGSNNLQWDNVAQVGNVAGRWNISGILNVGGQVTFGSLGTGILHSSSSGVISSSLINLAGSDVTGNLSVTHLNSGIGATGTNCWRGDGTWGACGSQSTFATSDYNFSAQTPGVSLGVGNTTITISPVPAGVSGTDTSHTLLVQGGIGTAESCLITGGTAVSNTPSGTLILNCGHTHTGNWTISSATNGGEEAYQLVKAGGVGGQIYYPAGVWVNCGTLTIDTDGVVVFGAGSGGSGITSGPDYTSIGNKGTQLVPCFNGQTLVSSPLGHPFPATQNKLSMHDMSFFNNGLSGIIGVYILRDASGIFDNLTFAGTISNFEGILADRVLNASFRNIYSTGTAYALIGSTTDVDSTTGWAYSSVSIENWFYVGTGSTHAALTLQRCVSCVLNHARFSDAFLTVTGTALELTNDSQGNELDDVVAEGFFFGINAFQNTVGGTNAGPGWTTITNPQMDCAGGTPCLNSAFVQINLSGTYYTQLINPTLSAVTGIAASGVRVTGNGLSLPNVNIIGGTYTLTQGNQIVLVAPGLDSVEIHNGAFNGASPGAAILVGGVGNVNNIVSQGNHFTNSGPTLSLIPGTTMTSSLFNGNSCSNIASVACNSLAYSQILACVPNATGTWQGITDAIVNTWGANITVGGGADPVGAYCNGANWTVAAK